MGGKTKLQKGLKIGKLTLLRIDTNIATPGDRWVCKCECGVERSFRSQYLKSSKPGIRSCGCIRRNDPEVGQVFGRLTVIRWTGEVIHGYRIWDCSCSCGNTKRVTTGNLRHGNTRSCGCLNVETATVQMTSHGMSRTRLYNIWNGIKDRCNNPKFKDYPYYGGRGITYHPSFETFEGFLAGIPDGYSDDLTIDRINTDGNYEPGNLRWASRMVQGSNKRNNVIVTDPDTGEKITISELSRRTGVAINTLTYRLKERK